MYNAYFIQHSFYLHPPPPFVLSHCLSYYYSVAFQGRCAQVLQIYGNRKLTDPHFQENIWPISVHPSDYIQPRNAQTNLHACRQNHPARSYAFVWDEDSAFLGHIKWSTKHSGNNQRGTVKDTRSQVLEAVNISAPTPTPHPHPPPPTPTPPHPPPPPPPPPTPPTPPPPPPPPPPPLSLSLSLCTQELIHKHCSPGAYQ